MYAGCWGTAPSGPIRGVPCAGLDAQQCSLHDDCQALHQNQTLCGTAPCSVVAANFLSCQTEGPLPPPPPPPPPPCDTLDERGCIERADCAPLYEGSGCTCDAAGCACSIWTFVSCGDAA
jgi:hypothetical protein